MNLEFENLKIRNACMEDAPLLARWWNDGAVMTHAGFPNGLGTDANKISESLKQDSEKYRRLILELNSVPVGEMNYREVNEMTASIRIKICDFSLHDKGLGKKYLSMLISALFYDYGYEKIVLDTNLKNSRAQHVYEKLGFRKIGVRENFWRNQLGELQSIVEYELSPSDFMNFAK